MYRDTSSAAIPGWMPSYRGILLSDVEGFTRRPSQEQRTIARELPRILESSFVQAGLSAVWESRQFPEARGDGYVFGFAPGWMPSVIHPWLDELQSYLSEVTIGAAPIRLRISLHIGSLPVEGGADDGNGTPRNEVHRLINARQLKACLARSSPNVTKVAAILSERCYTDTVAAGLTLHQDHFIETVATVTEKQFEQRAWIRVPMPSGDLIDQGVLGMETPAVDTSALEAGRTERPADTVRGVSGGAVNTGVIHGDQTVTRLR